MRMASRSSRRGEAALFLAGLRQRSFMKAKDADYDISLSQTGINT